MRSMGFISISDISKSIVNTRYCLILSLFIFSFASINTQAHEPLLGEPVVEESILMEVYKSATCSCCDEWIKHIEKGGFKARVHHPEDLEELKASMRITSDYSSCHTAVTVDGYVFEGHIPAKIIRRFLKEKPKGAFGLSVPAMPVGSPGMEYKEKFQAYPVYLLKLNGKHEVYLEIKTQAEQYD